MYIYIYILPSYLATVLFKFKTRSAIISECSPPTRIDIRAITEIWHDTTETVAENWHLPIEDKILLTTGLTVWPSIFDGLADHNTGIGGFAVFITHIEVTYHVFNRPVNNIDIAVLTTEK